MRIPTWIITGLLDSGKTTLVNRLLETELGDARVLVVQFESGDTPLKSEKQVRHLDFTKKELEQEPFAIAGKVVHAAKQYKPDLVLMEWNGAEHFHKLEKMFLAHPGKSVLSIEKVIYTASENGLKMAIADAGSTAYSQIAGSDCAFLSTASHRKPGREAELLYECNPDLHVYTNRDWKKLVRFLFHARMQPYQQVLTIAALSLIILMAGLLMSDLGIPVGRYVRVFLGVFFQAVPFLAIGVLLSSAIQVYLPSDWIQRHFPKSVFGGQLFAVAAGFCLPVCDCASIPVFKGLVKKGVPLPAAVTFMLVSPLINPVVILSTWYAFSGNYRMILARCGLGVLCAVVCGLAFSCFPYRESCLLEQTNPALGNCVDYQMPSRPETRFSRFAGMLRHAQNEFVSVAKFLLTGILVSTCFQNSMAQAKAGGQISDWKAVLFMMGLAFLLSLCSSSDAVVARSMAGSISMGGILGFLVFGPMMDIKNMAMLLSGFRTGFVMRLLVTAAVVCFVIVLLFLKIANGGVWIG